MKYSLMRAAAPAESGVDILVPPIHMYEELYSPHPVFVATEDRVDSILVPGATRSGLYLPSNTGPLELKAAIPPGSSET